MRTFNTYVASVFLYNSELWTLTPTMDEEINSFHRRLLRYAVDIRWPEKKTNKNLMRITKAEPWAVVIKRRRLTWLGHLMRLPEETPALKSLAEALNPSKQKIGRPKTTWLMMIRNDIKPIITIDLKNKDSTLRTLLDLTSDRQAWRRNVKNLLMQ